MTKDVSHHSSNDKKVKSMCIIVTTSQANIESDYVSNTVLNTFAHELSLHYNTRR